MAANQERPFTDNLNVLKKALGMSRESHFPTPPDHRTWKKFLDGGSSPDYSSLAEKMWTSLDAEILAGGYCARRKKEASFSLEEARKALGAKEAFIKLAATQHAAGGSSCGKNQTGANPRQAQPAHVETKVSAETEARRADLHAKLTRAQELHARDDNKEAIAIIEEVYHVAHAHGLKEQELEAVLNLGFTTSDRKDFKSVERRLRDAEKLIGDVKTPWHQVQYYRLRAKVLRHKKELKHAENALKKAIGFSESANEDVVQVGLLARADYVHLLCGEKRVEDANEHLLQLRKVLEKEDDSQPVALVAESLDACIHWAIAKGDMDQLKAFVEAATRHGSGREAAICIGHTLNDCANGARGMKATAAAVTCADAAERLGHVAQRPDMAFVAAYTAAGALAEDEDFHAAQERCLRLVDAAKALNEPKLRFALFQLLSLTSRQLGDKTKAVEMATAALRDTEGDAIALCMAKQALAEALLDSGRVKEAIEHARAADQMSAHADLPPEWIDQILVLIGDCAARLGDWNAAETAAARLGERAGVSSNASHRRKLVETRIQMHKMFRESLTSVLTTDTPLVAARTEGAESVQAANSMLVKGLITGWLAFPNAAERIYDVWGRGNLLRAMLNMRAFPNSFNVTLEVHTVEEARQAVRLWALLADVLVLIWKGATASSGVVTPVPRSFFFAGGGGYLATTCSDSPLVTSQKMKLGVPRVELPNDGTTPMVMTRYASLLPPEVGRFLCEEAMPLVAGGRLLVVPATGICCVDSGHGPLESLFAEACNAVPAIKGDAARLPASWVPFFPDIPLGALSDVAGEHETSLRRLRSLLFRKTRQMRGSGVTGTEAKELELEIQDVLALITDTQQDLRRKHGWSEAREAVASRCDGFNEEHIAPIFVLQSMGYRWRIEPTFGAPIFKPSMLPKDDEPVGTWLHPADTKPERLSDDQLREMERNRERHMKRKRK